ncbi:MAG: DUF4252 domain-containing protein [Nonlabens sp.]
MNKLILKLITVSAVIMITLASCDQEPTIQSYYVDSQEKEGFITTSIPKTVLGINEKSLSEGSKKAYESIDKVNVLVLPATDGKKKMVKNETELFNKILQDSKYKTLMTHNADGIKAKFVYDGSTDSIDEIIVFGSSEEMGMGVARVLGDNMNLGDIMMMMKELDGSNVNPGNLKGILQGMGVDMDENMKNSLRKKKDSMENEEI